MESSKKNILLLVAVQLLVVACAGTAKDAYGKKGGNEMENPLDYYSTQGFFSDPGKYGKELKQLPDDMAELCGVVQGLLVHVYWASQYGFHPDEKRKQETNLRTMKDKLERIKELDPKPFSKKRAANKKLVSTCRDFTLVLTSILRAKGIPARARCGFGRYFTPGLNEDHWVCEYWNSDQSRWILVDSQLDYHQKQVLNIRFDPCDVPRDMFIVGGKAWNRCRKDGDSPDNYGIFHLKGTMFIVGDLVRDVAALNKAELEPWDGWGMMLTEEKDLTDDDYELLDKLADLTMNEDIEYSRIREIYAREERIRVPGAIKVFTEAGVVEVDLGMK